MEQPSARWRDSSAASCGEGRPRAWRAASSSNLSLCAMSLTLAIRCNALAEFHQPQSHPGLDRPEWARRRLGDLLLGQSFEVRKLERPPLVGRQLRDRRAALLLPLARGSILLDVLARSRLRRILQAARDPGPGGTARSDPVDR